MNEMPSTQTIVHHRKPRVVQAVDVAVLMHIANRTGSVIEIVAAVGDSVLDSTPILRVLGGHQPVPATDLLNAIRLGGERTFEQDPKYAIRVLMDIAIKALSAASTWQTG